MKLLKVVSYSHFFVPDTLTVTAPWQPEGSPGTNRGQPCDRPETWRDLERVRDSDRDSDRDSIYIF